MPHDPVRIAETRAWLRKSERDLHAAAHALSGIPPLCWDTAFHCQQAAEKAMKGLLAWHDEPFHKTHNLEEIGEACLKFYPSLKDHVDKAAALTQYAWKYRYPGDVEEDLVPEEARIALSVAQDAYSAILALLPTEVRP